MIPTTTLIQQICSCIQKGRPLQMCANKYKVSNRELAKWLKEGRSDNCSKPEYEVFAVAIDEALADAQIGIIDKIADHGDADWRPLEKILKMINPELDQTTVTTSTNVVVSGEVTTTHQHQIVTKDSIGDIIGLIRGNLVGGTLNIGPRPISIGDGDDGENEPGAISAGS